MAARQVALDCEAADLKSLDIELEDDDRDVCHHLALLSKRVYEVYMTEVSSYQRMRVEDHQVACPVEEILG